MNGGSEEKKSLLLEGAASSANWKVKWFHILSPEYDYEYAKLANDAIYIANERIAA